MGELRGKDGSWAYSGPLDKAGLEFLARSRVISRRIDEYTQGRRADVPEPTEDEVRAEMNAMAGDLPPLA